MMGQTAFKEKIFVAGNAPGIVIFIMYVHSVLMILADTAFLTVSSTHLSLRKEFISVSMYGAMPSS